MSEIVDHIKSQIEDFKKVLKDINNDFEIFRKNTWNSFKLKELRALYTMFREFQEHLQLEQVREIINDFENFFIYINPKEIIEEKES